MSAARKVPVYRGRFGPVQAERLLWRAGFGPRPGEAERLAKKGLNGAVRSLTRAKRERLVGPAPVDDDRHRIAPTDAWGHDHLWWLDRMVRTSRPLVERMTLVWHDWFATSNSRRRLPAADAEAERLFRSRGLGSFEQLVIAVTKDPAMLLWLGGTDNEKGSPNENYGRELMELFTLGAGRGYTERDVREQARALTGWRNDWDRRRGASQLPLRPRAPRHRHQADLRQARALRLAGRLPPLRSDHPLHRSFFVSKLWGYFIPTPPSAATRRALERSTSATGTRSGPSSRRSSSTRRSTRAREWSSRPSSTWRGCSARRKRGIDTEAWTWLANQAGQQLFYPPNVAGWQDDRWLDTASFLARWNLAGRALRPYVLETSDKAPLNADKLIDRALDFWGRPELSPPTRRALKSFAKHAIDDADRNWKKTQYPPLIENALRHLIAISPDLQTS